ncbi:MAG TPA: 4-hydroxythreonine-4-phosphate dehydrogenase, partial [Gammaproteobacteria bacterium]|nr:4-hydroxythreonine-4-phosphate dehydrogenase [Gammaproteobacteria bacterium]
MSDVRRIALTPGEPAGIGPDLCIQVAQRPFDGELVAVADPRLLADRAARLGLPLDLREYDPAQPPRPHAPGTLRVAPVTLGAPVTCGRT